MSDAERKERIVQIMWPYLRAFLNHPDEGELAIEVTDGKVRAVLRAHPSDHDALSSTTTENGLKQAFYLVCKCISPVTGHLFRLHPKSVINEAVMMAVIPRSSRSQLEPKPKPKRRPQAPRRAADEPGATGGRKAVPRRGR
jgi:hypothetical protein